jgi:hypothetical protein
VWAAASISTSRCLSHREIAHSEALDTRHQLARQGAQDVGRRERLCQRDCDAVQNFKLTPVALGDAAPG